jgi:hypothetical protein
MREFLLTDAASGVHVDSFGLDAAALGLATAAPWSVSKRTLRGGRRDGVDLVEIRSGDLSLSVVPTRGMNLWRGSHRGNRLGWDSPVTDGPVHPAHVNAMQWGGIGWLDGFDELLARCGLEHNGAPYREGDAVYPLHGKIANIPAHRVAVQVADDAPHAVTVEGRVDEARLFGPRVRMTSRLTFVPGESRVTVRDEFTNLGDRPADLQVLYHWNFGPPYLEEGARVHAPARTIVPRNARAVEGLAHHDTYGPPEPGFAEQVYFYELHGDGPEGRTLAVLHNRAADRAVVLRFAIAQLPCFTVWKNTMGPTEGYVTGLEPATNYPNPKPVEKARGRVPVLPPGGSHVAETLFEVREGAAAVAEVIREVEALQGQGAPTIHPGPVEPFVAG